MARIINDIDNTNFPFSEETYEIFGICMEVHRILGKGFAEIVYKDALEYEFKMRGINYEREKEYSVSYKNIILPHRFYADFVVLGSIILEVKSTPSIGSEAMAQVLNYLAISKCKVGLIANFGELSFKSKRLIL